MQKKLKEPNAGLEIEKNSFQIITDELGKTNFTEKELRVVIRIIHATADFELAELIRFSPTAIEDGIEAIQAGKPIVTDVNMVKAGISRRFFPRADVVRCAIDDAEILRVAKETGVTRAAASIRALSDSIDGGIVAIGNAPTALMEILAMAREGMIRPALVVGVPVGFINAAESKAALAESDLTFITIMGRKGGSTIAAAMVNALGAMSAEDDAELDGAK